MENTITFFQHIFSSSESRGGYLPFQFSASLTDLQKEDIQVFGKIEHDNLVYKKLSSEGRQFFHIRVNGLDIYGNSIYLGNDLHSDPERPGNYITHSLIPAKSIGVNPIFLFEKFNWRKRISKDEDKESTPQFLEDLRVDSNELIISGAFNYYFDFIRSNPARLESLAKILDLLVGRFLYRPKGTMNKLIIVDDSAVLQDWVACILLCFPEKLANSLYFVANLKNSSLPLVCNLVLTESLELVPENTIQESFILNQATYQSSNYQPQSAFANYILESIKKGTIDDALENLATYYQSIPILEFNKSLNAGPLFFSFLEESAKENPAEFSAFLETYFWNYLPSGSLNELINRAFVILYEKQKRLDLSLELLLFLVSRSPTTKTILKCVDEFFIPKRDFYLNAIESFLARSISFLDINPNELYLLLDNIFRHKKIKEEVALQQKMLEQVAGHLIETIEDRFWLIDNELFSKIQSLFQKIFTEEADLYKTIQLWVNVKSKLSAISRKPIDWQALLDLLHDLDDLGKAKPDFLIMIRNTLPQISLDEVFSESTRAHALQVLSFLKEKKIPDSLSPKLPEVDLIKTADALLNNKNTKSEKSASLKTLSSDQLERLSTSKLFEGQGTVQRLILQFKPIPDLETFFQVLLRSQGYNSDASWLVDKFLTNSDRSAIPNNSKKLLELYVNKEEWRNLLDDNALQLIVNQLYAYYASENISEILRTDLTNYFEKLSTIRPRIKNNPVLTLNESRSSLLLVRNLKEFSEQCQAKLQGAKLSKSTLELLLDATTRIGWSHQYWFILLSFLKEQKAKDEIYDFIIDWLFKFHKPVPSKEYLIAELYISCMEGEFDYLYNGLVSIPTFKLSREEANYIHFVMQNRFTNNRLYSHFTSQYIF